MAFCSRGHWWEDAAMWAALALALLATGTAPPVVALLPLRPLGAPPAVVHALEVTLRNELAHLQEARLAPPREVAEALKREPDCEARIACAAAAAAQAGARQLIIGTTSQLGDSFMIDLKLLDPARFVGSLRVLVPGVTGAMLFVDGKHSGTLPLAQPLEGLTPGQHVVRVKDKSRETSTFVEVRFGRMTDATLDLGAAPVVAVPAAALPTIVAAVPRKPGWVRPAAIAALGAGIASGVIGVAFQARASPAAPAVANGSQVPAR